MNTNIEFMPFMVHYTNKSPMLLNGTKLKQPFLWITTGIIKMISNEYQSCIQAKKHTWFNVTGFMREWLYINGSYWRFVASWPLNWSDLLWMAVHWSLQHVLCTLKRWECCFQRKQESKAENRATLFLVTYLHFFKPSWKAIISDVTGNNCTFENTLYLWVTLVFGHLF